ncbi:sugar transferase [Humitalea rosea]|nr:sugar transferase [Humitalea rosea]
MPEAGPYALWSKRALDIAVAGVLLVLLAPLAATVALSVLAVLGRPVLFRQTRAGRDGVGFTILKFRSMAMGPGADAARLGGFGTWLRASALDELPQLVNVLRGEMSLVGPRPLPPDYMPHYSPRQALRLRVRPGLAGPAQALGRNAVPWAARLEADACYAETPPRLRADVLAFAGTLAVLLGGKGVTAPGHATMPRFDAGAKD